MFGATLFDPGKLWFHGSPLELTELSPGSTITQHRQLARVFSFKPTLVSIDDGGSVKHNGRGEGFGYGISEAVCTEDIEPHPGSVMAVGKEWLTRRSLELALVERVRVCPQEQLARSEMAFLRVRVIMRRLCVWFARRRVG